MCCYVNVWPEEKAEGKLTLKNDLRSVQGSDCCLCYSSSDCPRHERTEYFLKLSSHFLFKPLAIIKCPLSLTCLEIPLALSDLIMLFDVAIQNRVVIVRFLHRVNVDAPNHHMLLLTKLHFCRHSLLHNSVNHRHIRHLGSMTSRALGVQGDWN